MSQPWITVASISLVTAGIAAECNLLRLFLREWKEERRTQRSERARLRRPSGTRSSVTTQLSDSTNRRHPSGKRDNRVLIVALFAGFVPAFTTAAKDASTSPPNTFATATTPLPSPLVIPSSLSLQPVEPPPAQPTAPPAETAPPVVESPSPFSLQLNLDFTSGYFYHGIVQEDTGFIFQPAARLTINLYQHDDFKVDAVLGVWNSFHGQKTGAQSHGDFTEYWYESDLIGGIVLTAGKVSLTTTYTFLTSPSDAYETVQELDFTLAYDDTNLLGAFALHPYVLLGIETGADASDGANSKTGTYLELGIAPGFSFDLGKTPIGISFPISVGMSLDNYYQDAAGNDDTFGFFQIGAKASIPLPFGDRYGKWTLNAGISALFLGDHTADYNAGDDTEIIGTIGVQVNF